VTYKIRKQQKKDTRKVQKACKFKPNITTSEKSLNLIHKPLELTQPELKGLNNHMARILQAKQQKIAEQ
jgi:hypothetical protein